MDYSLSPKYILYYLISMTLVMLFSLPFLSSMINTCQKPYYALGLNWVHFSIILPLPPSVQSLLLSLLPARDAYCIALPHVCCMLLPVRELGACTLYPYPDLKHHEESIYQAQDPDSLWSLEAHHARIFSCKLLQPSVLFPLTFPLCAHPWKLWCGTWADTSGAQNHHSLCHSFPKDSFCD